MATRDFIVWTPKRVLILFGGIFLFLALYGVHAHFLGGYNGLPPLPEKFHPPTTPGSIESPETPTISESDKKILEAFGAECPELQRHIRLFLRTKGVALAAQEFDIEPDGRVKLSPFSACLFPKGKSDGKFAEINTIRCDIALLTLDNPVKNMAELANRKVVQVELRSKVPTGDEAEKKQTHGITIVNNRRTPQKTDDIEVRITNAPIFYDDRRNLIWTDGIVHLQDFQTQPHPTQIKAQGMEIQLTSGNSTSSARMKNAKNSTKGKSDGMNGVETLVLRQNVEMHLWVDPQSGFLANPQDFNSNNAAKTTKPAGGIPEKAHVAIHTNGPFHYDLTQELARFDSPPKAPDQHVQLTRVHTAPGKKTLQDQLICDHLELQFRRKAETPGRSTDQRAINKEIETALATAPPDQVQLELTSENLQAFGNEFFYRCPSATTGPQTTLKGQPMKAVKDAHKIQAPELHLIGADKNGQGQQITARGAGQIDLYDKATDNYSLHAVWHETLTSTKVKEDGRLLDFLVLTGDASFIDEDHKQELNGQKLQVWLETGGAPLSSPSSSQVKEGPKGSTPPGEIMAQPAMGSRQKPRRLEAFDKVSATSQDMIVRNANHLVVRFKDDGSLQEILPEAVPTSTTAQSQNPDPAKSPEGKTPSTAKEQQASGKTNRPIELEANEVVAYVVRSAAKYQLQELVCEGKVHVVQKGATPKDKGVDIIGDMLNLLHHPKGDILYVFGDTQKPGKMQMGEMVLIGPKITINQKENIAEVEGTGAMDMPSNTNLDGGKAVKTGSRLTVHWNKEMVFNGKFADFRGGVIAYQDHGSLKCQTMNVILDREVSFKEGQKSNQGAKVEKMVCDRQVFVLDEVKNEQGKVIGVRRLKSTQLNVDNQDGPTIAPGPGYVLFWGKESGPAGASPVPPANPAFAREPAILLAQAPAKTPANDMKLTRIDFEGRMFSNNKDNTRTSKFYDNVEVFHLPADNPDVAIDPNKPPKNGFYLRCDLLSVYTRQVEGKSSQLMLAERRVTFRTEEFYGLADKVKFDESQDHVIFEANPGNTVTINKVKQAGNGSEAIRGTKILFKRQTGEFILDGVRSIQSRLESPAPPLEISRSRLALAGRQPCYPATHRLLGTSFARITAKNTGNDARL